MEVQPKTPPWQDKRMFVAIGSVVALFVSHYTGHDLPPDLIVSIAGIVATWIGSSAAKEASITKALIAGQRAAAEVGTVVKAVDTFNATPPP